MNTNTPISNPARRTATNLIAAVMVTIGVVLLILAVTADPSAGWGGKCGGPCPTVPETTTTVETTTTTTEATTLPPTTQFATTTVTKTIPERTEPSVVGGDPEPVYNDHGTITPTPLPEPTPPSTPTLARTGTNMLPFAVLGILLFAGGVVLVRWDRKHNKPVAC
jgi:LPXTG-motif cell wall-anchored protein